MNSLQNLGANYGQQPIGSLGGNLPSNPAERDMNLYATNSLPPAFRSGATSIQAQQALAQRLQQAGYRFDDAKLNEIQRLSDEQKLEKENLIYMGAGLMMIGGDPLYNLGERSMQRTGQFVKEKFLKDSWLDNFDNMGEKTSLRQAGLQRNAATNVLELLDPEERTGLKGLWNRKKFGIRAVNHADYIEAAKELKLKDLKKLYSHLPDEVLRKMPESAVTSAGKFGKQLKQAISPVTDAVGKLYKDVLKLVPSDPLPPIATATPEVTKFNSKTAKMVKEPPPPTAGFFNFKEMGHDWKHNKWKFAKGVGGKALGVAGIGLTVYAAGSNAMDNYKNKNYRAIATDLTGEAVGVVVSSVATGALAWALVPVAGPIGMLAAGVIGGVIGQGATNITKWAVDPFFKLFGLKNADDNHRDKIKENRELLTNIAVGTGSALGNALKSVPRQATISSGNPSMFANNPATATNAPMIKGALDF